MLINLKNNIGFILSMLLTVLLMGCARGAPDLPPDTRGKTPQEAVRLLEISKDDMKLGCVEITREKQGLTRVHDIEEATIRSNRTNNQVAGYFGTFFPPAYLATTHNSESKNKLDSIQVRFDQLYFLGHVKNCKDQSE